MEQVKYILHSVLILVGAALTYAVMKPMVETQWIASSKVQETSSGSTSTMAEKKVIKNVAGKNIFLANCASCHALDKDLTGPALRGVETRGPWTDRKNLVKWVHNPGAFIPTTPYTTALAASRNGQVMPSFTLLDEKDIDRIFDYIKEASSSPTAPSTE